MIRLVPFLIAAFLFVNPLLGWIVQKFKIQIEKLQFWVMLTSGTAWIIAVIYFLINPQLSLSLTRKTGLELLPSLDFSLDWISAGLVLAAAGLVFGGVLNRQDDPLSNAWLAGMGGASVLGLGANSAYTLGWVWTILEGFHFYFSNRNQKIASDPRKYLPVLLVRLSAPSILVLFSLTLGEPGSASLLSSANLQTGPVLILAGLVGFFGWFLSYQPGEVNQSQSSAGLPERWIPALLGLMLILRGGEITRAGMDYPALPLILSLLLLITALAGLLLGKSPELWFLGCGLMVAAAAFVSGPASALSWGIALILPGLQLWRLSSQPRRYPVPLALTMVGFLPIPFLPAWAGVLVFAGGAAGFVLGIGYGVLLGGVLIVVLKNWQTSRVDQDSFSLLQIIGGSALLVSQVLISLRLDLIPTSLGLLSKPLTIWIGLLGLIPVLILGNHVPLKKADSWGEVGRGRVKVLGRILIALIHFLDRLVTYIANLFEGQGGLIWTLLIGLLLITLISLRGG